MPAVVLGNSIYEPVIRRDATPEKETLVSLKQSSGICGASEKRPLDESAVVEFITETPLDMPVRLRRRDVRTDDAARQPVSQLPRAPTPAVGQAASPACPSPATSAFDSGDNTPGTTSDADTMTLH